MGAVRTIFDLYVEHGSLLPVVTELNRRGLRRKSWTTKEGKRREARPWDKANLLIVLRNPLYTGRQKLGDETFKGEHPAIVPKATFDRVQRILDENRRTGGASSRNQHGALLRGILRCGHCDAAMTHASTMKALTAYRYYRCVRSIKSGSDACPTGSVPAKQIEEHVVAQIQRIGSDPTLREETFRQAQVQVATETKALRAEAKRIERERMTDSHTVGQLVAVVARATGVAADALMARLGEAQARLATIDARSRDVAERLEAVASEVIHPDDLGRALEQFTPIWDVLAAQEKERIMRLLLDRVDYDGRNDQLKLTFSATGARLLAADSESAGVTS